MTSVNVLRLRQAVLAWLLCRFQRQTPEKTCRKLPEISSEHQKRRFKGIWWYEEKKKLKAEIKSNCVNAMEACIDQLADKQIKKRKKEKLSIFLTVNVKCYWSALAWRFILNALWNDINKMKVLSVELTSSRQSRQRGTTLDVVFLYESDLASLRWNTFKK